MSARRVLIPPGLSSPPPIGGGHLARTMLDFSGATMGTHWLARVVSPTTITRDEIERLIVEALALVVARMSPWETDSDLERYRTALAGEWVPVAPETYHVLNRALAVAALTAGRYDPTIGRLTDALGFGPSDPASAALPASQTVAAARAATGYARLQVDPTNFAVFQPGGFQLDLCSIAKGYAVDLVITRLQAIGIHACFVEIGGEARGLGCKPDGHPWWCQLAPPTVTDHGLPSTVIAACDLAIATSGNTLRYRSLPDGVLGHILDPRTAAKLDPQLDSVTVLAPSCIEADVYATALFLLGAVEGSAFAEAHHLAALFVERDSTRAYRERWTSRFAEFFE